MIELLQGLDLFQDADEGVLRRFADAGTNRRMVPGDVLLEEGATPAEFIVIADGTVHWSRCINGVDITLVERAGPTYAGAGNLLTGDPAVATGRAVTELDVITWDRETFMQYLSDVPNAMQTAVRLIAPVAQRAESLVLQQEKLAALGTLSAGLAHELNNPAAAARRTAAELAEALSTLEDTVHQFVSSGVEREEAARLVELQQEARRAAASAQTENRLTQADREEALAGRLDQLGLEGWRLAEPLCRAQLPDRWLDEVAATAGGATGAAVEWVAASLTAEGLVDELHESTRRISDLVSAIKEYTHMDRAAVAEVDVHDGIESTLTILGYRLKHGDVKVERQYDRSLPRVTAYGSELNQVWTNLLSNALDAMDGRGTITIATRPAGEGLAVDIADDGPGIPADAQGRVFDPFFTTKPVGEGTGLGLDIVHRIVQGHRGDVSLRSRPGETVFTVTLPPAG
jgi:signal transduction histidine kinase